MHQKPDSDIVAAQFPEYADSLYTGMKIIPFRFQQIEDSTYLDSSFFSTNLKLARQALTSSPWREKISENDFDEYILPYKIDDELADNWRAVLYEKNQLLLKTNPQLNNADSLYAYHTKKTYFALRSSNQFGHYYPAQANYSWLNLSREGDCADRCRYVIYHLRAAGLPATYDYIPNWGNRPKAQHTFVGLANKKQQLKKRLENSNDTSKLVDDFNAAMTSKYRPVFSQGDVPSNLTVQYEKTIPKVYRQTWSKQPRMEDLVTSVPKGQIYEKLLRTNMLDVTDQYLKTADASVWQRPFGQWDMAYLATFDISGWTPVAFAQFGWWGQARFKSMGKNILYLPMVCKNQKLLPVAVPFILNNNGDKKELNCNYDQKIDMRLIRKFPLFSYTAAHVVDLKGCIVYGSNDYRFGEKEKLAEIDYYPFFMDEIEIHSPKKYRYVKVEAPDGKLIRLAQLACYSDSADTPVLHNDVRYLAGKIRGHYGHLFDGDLNSYTLGRMFLVDLGEPVRLSAIRICPRNDTNYIIPGNQYELFYWDNQWQSAGKQTATNYFLEYRNVPSGTIYWLRCLNGGREERIFTYENNKQIWW
ncbi:hypothetical protein [Mangrovibacterium marinum]|nr:hypothetical protein [Mangrovibacterium marinum]